MRDLALIQQRLQRRDARGGEKKEQGMIMAD
jgi:hypothetical protein